LRILTITVLAIVPWFAVGAIGTMLIGRRVEVAGSFPAMIGLLLIGALQTIALSLLTVIVSLVFIALGAKTKRSVTPVQASA
jgi:hypothetical protein